MAIRKIIKRATDALFTNTEFDGTEATRMVKGTTGERANVEAGDLRFNTTTNLMEYYDGTQWKSIDAPPIVSSIDPSNIADSDSDVDIVITGSNFSTNPTVTAIGQDASVITPTTVVRDSNTQITATFDGTDFLDAQEDYGIKVENTSGLSNTLGSALAVNATPAWTVASGSLGTFGDIQRTGISITTGATDDEGASLTYALDSGSLPSGLSLNTSTGAITGDATAVGSDTTSNFTLSVTDGANTTTRAYSITINAPVITTYTSTGSGTFSVPSGITAVDVLVVGGGGNGGGTGGGGAGGLIYRPAFPVTPGGSVSYTVGAGAARNNNSNGWPIPAKGQNSVFGTLTALAGGQGGAWQTDVPTAQINGGSGGGGSVSSPVQTGGQGLQSQQPGDSGTYGFGNPGGDGSYPVGGYYWAGGGGGAGAAGEPNSQNRGGNGGIGKAYDISGTSYYYAGGGGGGAQHSSGGNAGQAGQGGGGGGAHNPGTGGTPGQGTSMHNGNQGQNAPGGSANGNPYGLAGDAAANSGAGGGAMAISVGAGGAGGSGIVIVRY
jgi:hypothetical protein